jgi:hypothetical protein
MYRTVDEMFVNHYSFMQHLRRTKSSALSAVGGLWKRYLYPNG